MYLDLPALLKDVAETFREYEQHHLHKEPQDFAKAARNREMAERVEAALKVVDDSERANSINLRNQAMTDALSFCEKRVDPGFMSVGDLIEDADAIFKYVMKGEMPKQEK